MRQVSSRVIIAKGNGAAFSKRSIRNFADVVVPGATTISNSPVAGAEPVSGSTKTATSGLASAAASFNLTFPDTSTLA
jgi:hypothetical protein